MPPPGCAPAGKQFWFEIMEYYAKTQLQSNVAPNIGQKLSNYQWPITLGAGLYTTCRGERVVVVIRFNATFLPLRPYMCNSFLNDAESLTTYGCAL